MRIYWDENYPRQYGEGAAEGIRLAYAGRDSENGIPAYRGGPSDDPPGWKTLAWNRGFVAGYMSARKAIGYGESFYARGRVAERVLGR